MDTKKLIEEWKKMKAGLERQLAAFDPPVRPYVTRGGARGERQVGWRGCLVTYN